MIQMATLFFSYSHKDEELRDRLEVHLAMLKREGLIEAWHDRRILAGDEFDREINKELEDADVILLLVSPDFLASRYCYDIEVQRAMQRHEQGLARVVPVILKPSDWTRTLFAKLVAAPTDGRPVTKWPDRDEAFLDVVKQIRASLPTKPAARVPQGQELFGQAQRVGSRPAIEQIPVLKKSFTDSDKDRHVDEAFDYMALFFENSLKELGSNRNPGIEGRFKTIDARSFTAVIYRDGKKVSHCAIQHGSSRGFGGGITYSTDERSMGNSFNEQLTIEADDQSLFLKPMGTGM